MANNTIKMKNLLTLESKKTPIVSIVMPLSPKIDDSVSDKTQLNSLITDAKAAYLKQYPSKDWPKYEQQLQQLLQTETLGNDVSQGLALYVSPDDMQAFRLNYPVDTGFAVSETMQVLPLMKDYQFTLAYNLIIARKDTFRLFQIKDRTITEIDDPNMPKTLTGTLGEDLIGGKQKQKSTGTGRGTTLNAHNPKEETVRNDQGRFFKAIDEYVRINFTNKDHLPVVLAALVAEDGEFRKVSQNPLLSKDIKVNKIPSMKTSHQEILNIVRSINQQFNAASIKELASRYDAQTGAKKTLTDIHKIVDAAVSGQVDTLFIKRDAYIPEKDTANIQYDMHNAEGHPSNALNDLAITVSGFDGPVYILDEADMPVKNENVAAIIRFPQTESQLNK